VIMKYDKAKVGLYSRGEGASFLLFPFFFFGFFGSLPLSQSLCFFFVSRIWEGKRIKSYVSIYVLQIYTLSNTYQLQVIYPFIFYFKVITIKNKKK
jgi:hypothetical protein